MSKIEVGQTIYIHNNNRPQENGEYMVTKVGPKFFEVENHFWDQFHIDPNYRKGERKDKTKSPLEWYYSFDEFRKKEKLLIIKRFISSNLNWLTEEELVDIQTVIKRRINGKDED